MKKKSTDGEKPAKKTPVKKVPTGKIPTKKPPVKKLPVKETPTKKVPVKKASTKKAPAKPTSTKAVRRDVDAEPFAYARNLPALAPSTPIQFREVEVVEIKKSLKGLQLPGAALLEILKQIIIVAGAAMGRALLDAIIPNVKHPGGKKALQIIRVGIDKM